MKTSRRILVVCASLTLSTILLLFSGDTFGQMRKMSPKELSRESTAILVGKCTQKESFWNDKRDKIFTRVKIQTDENIKGDLGAEAEIIIPGGRVGNIIYEVSEMPAFYEGEKVFVFLWRHPSGMYLVTGGHQGKLEVIKDKKTGKKVLRGGPWRLDEARILDKRITQETIEPKKIFLEDFIKEVKRFLKE